MRKSRIVGLMLLTSWCGMFGNAGQTMGNGCQQNENQTSKSDVKIFQSNGKPAEQATVISIAESKQFQLFNSGEDGKFSPQLVNDKGENLPLPTTPLPTQAIEGATMTRADSNGRMPKNAHTFSHLVVSRDRSEVAFVPPGYAGNIQLRPCGTIRLDASNLDLAEQAVVVVVVWKNCLAGTYALCGNKQPGDPANDEHDWRFRPFFTVTTVVEIGPGSDKATKDIYLPPGEVSVAAVSYQQFAIIEEFAASNLSQDFKHNLTQLPATSGIHRMRQSETTTVPVQLGTCVKGKITSESQPLPNWNDAGFVDAYVTIDDVWTSRLDWIPGYDMRKGVNHYFKVLESETGLKTRARTLAATKAILKVDGRFLTFPLPHGQYNGHLFRPDLTKEFPGDHFDPNRGPRVLPVGVLLRRTSDDPASNRVAMQHLLNARLAIWWGDLETAGQQIELAKTQEATGEIVLESLNEAMGMIEQHSNLLKLREYNDGAYNRQAAEFLLKQARGFLKHSDFGRAGQLLQHAKSFPVDFSALTVKPDEIRTMLHQARAQVLDGSKAGPYQSSFILENDSPEFIDLGEFTYSVTLSTSPEDEAKKNQRFNPLSYKRPVRKLTLQPPAQPDKSVGRSSGTQSVADLPASDRGDVEQQIVTQIKAIDDQNSAEFRSAVAKLKSTISAQFDEKLLARNAELAQLEERIKTARQRLKKREVNRDEILKQRIRKILLENGIELSEPLNKKD